MSPKSQTNTLPGGSARVIGRTAATLMTAGMIIGTGIFGALGATAAKAGSALLLAMLPGGLVTLATGVSGAQLGVNFPKQGGAFVWARAFRHDTLAFIAGCCYLGQGIVGTGVVSLAFAHYSAQIVGHNGEFKDGVFKFTLGRPTVPLVCTRCGNLEIDAAIGYNTRAAFQGTSERSAVCGDFAMLESEVHLVIRELHAGNIEVVAVHNHMFFEDPRVIYLHYWGIGKANELAQTFRRALDTQH